LEYTSRATKVDECSGVFFEVNMPAEVQSSRSTVVFKAVKAGEMGNNDDPTLACCPRKKDFSLVARARGVRLGPRHTSQNMRLMKASQFGHI
jgi:hypothetical protein